MLQKKDMSHEGAGFILEMYGCFSFRESYQHKEFRNGFEGTGNLHCPFNGIVSLGAPPGRKQRLRSNFTAARPTTLSRCVVGKAPVKSSQAVHVEITCGKENQGRQEIWNL